MRPLACFSCAWVGLFVASCSFDESGISATNGDASIGDASIGSGNPDAPVVGCVSNDDCATPPDLCHLAGTCDQNGTCQFAAVDCSAVDGACVAGQCDPSNGSCTQVAANEGAVCDAPLVGEWSGCHADATCGSNGQRRRLVSAQTCTSGACMPGEPVEETASCWIDPGAIVGTPCGAFSCGSWGDCEAQLWDSECSTSGEQSRQCSGSSCSIIGTCDPGTWSQSTSCVLDTNGDDCWGCWDGPGLPGGDCVCDGGTCVPDPD